MEEFSTAPIPGSTRAEDQRRPTANTARRLPEDRHRVGNFEPEMTELDDAPENSEPKHDLDVSV